MLKRITRVLISLPLITLALMLLILEIGRFPVCEMGIKDNCVDNSVNILVNSDFGQFVLDQNSIIVFIIMIIATFIGALIMNFDN